MARKRIGEFLVENNVITQGQLDSALAEQERYGGKLGQHLVRQGAINETQLLDFLSEQLGVAKIDFRKSGISASALKTVPRQVCVKHALVPVARKEEGIQKSLLVAMCKPFDLEAINEVEFVSNCRVTTVLALEEDIRRAIEYCYSADGLRGCEDGLPVDSKGIDFVDLGGNPVESNEKVVITQEGRELILGAESRSTDIGLRALIEILVEKGVLTLDEFHERLEQLKEK